jgi:flagellar M-ring protein FliF
VAEVAQIENTVGATVGAITARGDQVTVFSREFFAPTAEEETLPQAPRVSPVALVVTGLSCMLLMGGVMYLVRRRRQRTSTIDLVVGDTVEETAAVVELSPEEQKRREREQFIEDLARSDPENMVGLLRTWMSED